jgi:hypothetical protein
MTHRFPVRAVRPPRRCDARFTSNPGEVLQQIDVFVASPKPRPQASGSTLPNARVQAGECCHRPAVMISVLTDRARKHSA